MTPKEHIEQWILNDLSVPNERFNMLPRCPYAKKALIDNRILFLSTDNYYKDIEDTIDSWNDTYEIAVVHLDKSLTTNAVANLRTMFNNMYEEQDFFFVEDYIESNNMHVMLVQRTSGIEKARQQLKETGYYSGDPQSLG